MIIIIMMITVQGSKRKKNRSRLLATIKEKRSPNAKMQSPEKTRLDPHLINIVVRFLVDCGCSCGQTKMLDLE